MSHFCLKSVLAYFTGTELASYIAIYVPFNERDIAFTVYSTDQGMVYIKLR